jgi:ribose transport system ATP-binding protein
LAAVGGIEVTSRLSLQGWDIEEMQAPRLVEVTGLSKSYGANRVLAAIDFHLNAGESVAVIGENGAGKSTFAKILTGVIRPDAGAIRLQGERVGLHSPRDALRQGIALIPQELAYVPHLTVAENIVLGNWPSWRGLTWPRAWLRRAAENCRRFNIALDVGRTMATLKLAERQIVEIVKALSRKARLIVLDEPTASLSEQESRTLFAILGRLTAEGVGIIYISHRMDEVYRFSDRVVVFRNGELVASVVTSQTTPAQLIGFMLGQQKESFAHAAEEAHFAGQSAVDVRDWTRQGMPSLAGVSFSLGVGEIVGLYGLRGSGAELVAEGLAGLRPDIAGALALAGRSRALFPTPLAAKRANVAYVPAERKRDGLVLMLPIRANLVMLIVSLLARWGFIRRRLEQTRAADLAAKFDVRCASLNQTVRLLSGGNQQKVLLASRMAAEPRLLILQEPTRGVDVGARVEIHRFLAGIADRGCAVLLVTADVEEAVAVSHRLLVMREGRIAGELKGPRKTQAQAIALAAGSAI